MGDMLGVRFIGVDDNVNIHTLEDWGCYMHNRQTVTPPEVKWLTEDIPGANGKLNYTKALSGRVNYKNRTLHIELFVLDAMIKWDAIYSMMLDALHGRQFHIIFDSDANYFYDGWAYIVELQSSRKKGIIVIECDVEPFKYEMYSSLDDWLWDPFNFEDGIIREYKNLTVSGTRTLIIPGRRMEVVPTFTVHSTGGTGMDVTFEGVTYHLSEGDSRVPAIDLGEGDNELIFAGTGTVSVDYRGGRL